MSDDRPTYGEAIMNAVSIEAKAVLAFMADVHKLRALSADAGAARSHVRSGDAQA